MAVEADGYATILSNNDHYINQTASTSSNLTDDEKSTTTIIVIHCHPSHNVVSSMENSEDQSWLDAGPSATIEGSCPVLPSSSRKQTNSLMCDGDLVKIFDDISRNLRFEGKNNKANLLGRIFGIVLNIMRIASTKVFLREDPDIGELIVEQVRNLVDTDRSSMESLILCADIVIPLVQSVFHSYIGKEKRKRKTIRKQAISFYHDTKNVWQEIDLQPMDDFISVKSEEIEQKDKWSVIFPNLFQNGEAVIDSTNVNGELYENLAEIGPVRAEDLVENDDIDLAYQKSREAGVLHQYFGPRPILSETEQALAVKFPGLPTRPKEAVEFLQQHGILPLECKCQQYGHSMRLCFKRDIFWRDSHSTCNRMVTIRKGTWCSDTCLPFVTIIRFIYGWAHELTSLEWCRRELGLSAKTIVKWNKQMREVCVEAMRQQKNKKIGGRNKIVEIDESHFTNHKRNGNRELRQLWVFGGFCRETRECFVVQAPNRNVVTLMQIIGENVEDGSTIVSECWRRFKEIEVKQAGFEQFQSIHNYNFIDSGNEEYSENMDKLWGFVKWRSHKQRGTARHYFESYLIEFMWRNRLGRRNPFDAILTSIKEHWPPKMEL